MSRFEVESGIEIPFAKRGRYAAGSSISSAIRSLDIGQSIFFQTDKNNSVSAIVSRVKMATGIQFVTRRMEKDGKKGVRVWRV